MRILVFGLQSSGSTLATFLLGQKQGSIVIPDLFHDALMPTLNEVDSDVSRIVAKCTVTTRYSLEEHEANYQPDKTILVLRQPGSNYVSLERKPHRNWSGSMDEKFRLLEDHFKNRKRFDAIIRYEDLVLNQSKFTKDLAKAGVEVDPSHYEIPRSRLSILKENAIRSTWCRRNYRKSWGLGRLRSDNIETKYVLKYVPKETDKKLKRLCPYLRRWYKSYTAPLRTRIRAIVIQDMLKKKVWEKSLKPYLKIIYKKYHKIGSIK